MKTESKVTPIRCCGRVKPASSIFMRFRQCEKSAVVERNGKHYCKIHDPVFIKQKQDARYDAETKWQEQRKHDFECVQACKGMKDPVAEVESLLAIKDALSRMVWTFGEPSKDGTFQEKDWCSGDHLTRQAVLQEAKKRLDAHETQNHYDPTKRIEGNAAL